MTGCYIANNGDLGISSYNSGFATIDHNRLVNNGGGGYNPGWQSGAIKLTGPGTHGVVIDSNEVTGWTGSGIWFDLGAGSGSANTISNNRVHDGADTGIHYEISTQGNIHDTLVWNVRGGGNSIFSSTSGNVQIWNNTVWVRNSGTTAIHVMDDSGNRGDYMPDHGQNIQVHDNKIIFDGNWTGNGSLSLSWWQSGPGQLGNGNAHATNNGFWYPVPEDGGNRFQWLDSLYSHLSDFGGTPGGSGSYYMSQAQRDAAVAPMQQ